MILSFHPIIEADRNIICAGREPDDHDLAAIRQADAVLLPQGCYASLYDMVRNNCRHWFPNMDVRFDYPGKCGQARLFSRLNLHYPLTVCYPSMAAYGHSPWQGPFPAVVKLDWGGEGETVFKANSPTDLEQAIQAVGKFDLTGQPGFIVQKFIPSSNRSLRVTVVGTQLFSYWRLQPQGKLFGTAVARGALIDHDSDPDLQEAAKAQTRSICRQTGIQLAGLDFLFDETRLGDGLPQPLILEINHFFGRKGLGGSDAYYRVLETEADRWLAQLGLKRSR